MRIAVKTMRVSWAYFLLITDGLQWNYFLCQNAQICSDFNDDLRSQDVALNMAE